MNPAADAFAFDGFYHRSCYGRPYVRHVGGHYFWILFRNDGSTKLQMTDEPAAANDLLFEVRTPLGFNVRVTAYRWKLIIAAKHPVMAGREASYGLLWRLPTKSARAERTSKCYSSTRRRR